MASTTIKGPDGMYVILCGPRRTPKNCLVCKRPSSRLCDFRLASGKTCDAPLCSSCTVRVGADVDHCPSHPAPDHGGKHVLRT